MNSCSFVGRLVDNPELRYTPSGVGISTFTLAVERKFKNKNGERETDFLDCQAWRGLSEVIANHCKKGNQIGIVARYQKRKYQNNEGQNRYAHEFVVSELTFCQKANSNSRGNTVNSNTGQSGSSGDPFKSDGKPIDISDDDLPFR
jgi:single-strand DNA-binding protein